jgi:hypothetical protein
MGDFYTANPRRLQSQPKRTIGLYVASNRIPLAPILTFKAAQENPAGTTGVICRSEHVQEYNGVSGLLGSPKLSRFPQARTEKELADMILNDSDATPQRFVSEYIRRKHLTRQRFAREVSFSYWKYVPGYNLSVIADSSVPNQYHLISYYCEKTPLENGEHRFEGYARIRDGAVDHSFMSSRNPAPFGHLEDAIPLILKRYEQIRQLDHFDPNHCPTMEFQLTPKELFFLQYHRTRDFAPASFTLKKAPDPRAISVPFVRGATSPEGMDLNITIEYYQNWKAPENTLWPAPRKPEEASFDLHDNPIYTELTCRKRKLSIVALEGGHPSAVGIRLNGLAYHHLQKSIIFKSKVSIIMPDAELLPEREDLDHLYKQSQRLKKDIIVPIHFVSDGITAYIWRLDRKRKDRKRK